MEAPFVEAIKNGDLEKIHDWLTNKNYQKYLFKSVFEGDFPLHIAAKERNVNMVKALLEAGANPNQGSEVTGSHRGYTAAHEAANNGDIDILIALKEFKADFNRPSDDKWYPLHCSVYKGHHLASTFLLDNGAEVNCETSYYQTPLCFAASHGRPRDVRLLLRRGASVELNDPNFDTLMHHAMHYRMSKLFEGNYDVPESQLDVAVILSLHGVEPTKENSEKENAFAFFKEDIPSFEKFLSILYNNAPILSSIPTEWNYLSLVGCQVDMLIGLGIPPTEAKALRETVEQVEKERQEAKERRLAEAPTGGCPVMRGKRKTTTTTTTESEKSAGSAAVNASAADPSGGRCPFFQKSKDAVPASDVALPAGHPPVDSTHLGGSTDDPSGGKCPFFQKSQDKATPSTTTQNTGKKVSPQDIPFSGCALSVAYIQRNMTVVLLMGMAFIFGMWVDQVLHHGL